MLFILSQIYFLKGRRVNHLAGDQHMKKKFYKNNVGCYYFYDVSISGKFERIVFIL